MKWYVYVVRCVDDTLYVGIVHGDVARRIKEHNESNRGAKYTRGRRPVVLVGSCECETRSDAQKIEAKIKSLPRDKKLLFLQSLA